MYTPSIYLNHLTCKQPYRVCTEHNKYNLNFICSPLVGPMARVRVRKGKDALGSQSRSWSFCRHYDEGVCVAIKGYRLTKH